MRTLMILVVLVVAILAAAIFVVPAFLPQDLIREQVALAVERETGRQLKIDGDVRLAVFPSAKLHASDVSFSNMPGGKAEHMAEMESLDIGLALWPLLSRRAEIQSFVLVKPAIHLEVDKSGKANWQFETTPPQASAAKQNEQSGADRTGAPLSDVRFGDVRIVDGLVTYDNAQTGASYEVSTVNTTFQLPSLDEPFELSGNAILNGEKITVDGEVTRPKALFEEGDTALEMRVKGNPLSLSFKGSGSFVGEMSLEGRTEVDIPSVKDLAAWTGSPISGAEKGPGFGAASIKGDMAATGSTFAFTGANLRFDEIEATGNLKATFGDSIPLITANLATPVLDLRPYVSERDSAAGSPETTSASGNSGWATDKIDFSALKSFNAILDFEAGGLLIQDMKIGQSDLAIRVRNGVLTADLADLALYDGSAKGNISIDSRSAKPTLKSKLSIAGVALAPFLKDAAQTDRFEGTGTFALDLSGAGASQREIVSSLNGNGSIRFTDGAIRGVDLNQITAIVNSLIGKAAQSEEETQEATEAAKGAGEKTEFVELGGTFQVAQGIVQTNDLKLINELISVSGRGSVNLPEQTVNMRLDPGQSQTDGGLKVALRVTGPWNDLKYTPDPSELIEKEIRKRLGDSPAGSVLDQLLGKDKSEIQESDGEAESAEDIPEKDPAQQLLEGLFGK